MKKGCYLTVLLVWVLWARTECCFGPYTPEHYIGVFEPIGAYDTKKECDVAAAQEYRLSEHRTIFLHEKGFPGRPGVLDKNGQERPHFQTTLRCLPDTVDPRGPKK